MCAYVQDWFSLQKLTNIKNKSDDQKKKNNHIE